MNSTRNCPGRLGFRSPNLHRQTRFHRRHAFLGLCKKFSALVVLTYAAALRPSRQSHSLPFPQPLLRLSSFSPWIRPPSSASLAFGARVGARGFLVHYLIDLRGGRLSRLSCAREPGIGKAGGNSWRPYGRICRKCAFPSRRTGSTSKNAVCRFLHR